MKALIWQVTGSQRKGIQVATASGRFLSLLAIGLGVVLLLRGGSAGGLWLMGWSRDGGDLRVAHFFATHAMHVVPLLALGCAKMFGREAKLPIHLAALAYIVLVAGTFIQALMGRPFLAG